jgi:hypothetical protein
VNSPCRVPAGVTERKRLLQGIDRPCGENAAELRSFTERKMLPRGQRVLDGLSGVRLGSCVEMESVRHNTVAVEKCDWMKVALLPFSMLASPSRRGRPRRVIRLASISTSVRCPSNIRDVRRRYAAYFSRFLLNLPAGLRVPCFCRCPVLIPLSGSAHTAPGNLDTEQLFSYCYELRTRHRLESVATRTPPPICTSAQGSQTALVSRTAERCERSNSYTMVLV